MNKLPLVLALISVSAFASGPGAEAGASKVARNTTAINFGHASSTRLALAGTDLMKSASGELKVSVKASRVEVELKAEGLQPATSFGLEYLTYVVWAVSPQGRADNLGELVLEHNSAGKLKATTELQTFGLIVTAEPYFAVTQPSSLVVMETAADSSAGAQAIQFSYELLGRDAYSSSNQKIDNAIFGIDPNTPLALFEARNALRIARSANAAQYSADALGKAQQSLQQAETAYREKQLKAVITYARDAAQNAEDARVMALKKQEQDRLTREA